jgi:hypothetical protein
MPLRLRITRAQQWLYSTLASEGVDAYSATNILITRACLRIRMRDASLAHAHSLLMMSTPIHRVRPYITAQVQPVYPDRAERKLKRCRR